MEVTNRKYNPSGHTTSVRRQILVVYTRRDVGQRTYNVLIIRFVDAVRTSEIDVVTTLT